MKKILLFSLIPLLLTSCNSNRKANILLGSENYSTPIYLEGDDVKSQPKILLNDLKNKLIDKKEDSIVCVYGAYTCWCWKNFVSNCLNKLIENYKCKIYCLQYSNLKDISEGEDQEEKDQARTLLSLLKKGLTSDSETFYLIDDGQNIFHKTYNETDKFFSDYDTFENTIKDKIVFPKIIDKKLSKIKTETLDCTDNETHLVYHHKESCEDCSYIEKNMLKEYAEKNILKNISMLNWDASEVKNYEDGYQKFKEDFSLNEQNKKFGFGDGYAPTFQVWKEKNVVDSITLFNDTILKSNDKYFVSSSFFNKERINFISYIEKENYSPIVGKEVALNELESYEEDGETKYFWKHEFASKVYEPYFESFANKYLKI